MLWRAVLILLASLVPLPALQAAEGPWLRTDFAQIRLVAATQAVGDLDKIPAAVEFLLQPGWKVYWRSPGDAGLPPRLYEGSADGPPVALDFPVPERFSLFGLDSYGYAAEVLLPLQLDHAKGAPGSWEFWLDALICSDICVPVSGPLRLDLPPGRCAPQRTPSALPMLQPGFRGRAAGRICSFSLPIFRPRTRRFSFLSEPFWPAG